MIEARKFQPVISDQPAKEDVVENVVVLDLSPSETNMWSQVKLKGRTELFALHANWLHFFGGLKAGDRVRYVESKCRLGTGGTRGIDKEGWLLFDMLRKIEEKKEFEDEVAKSYG